MAEDKNGTRAKSGAAGTGVTEARDLLGGVIHKLEFLHDATMGDTLFENDEAAAGACMFIRSIIEDAREANAVLESL